MRTDEQVWQPGMWRSVSRQSPLSAALRMSSVHIRTLLLVLSTVFYLLFGAAVFDALESEGERARKEELEVKLKELKQKFGFLEDEYAELEGVMLLSEPHRCGRQWKFTGSFYFAITVITTIGK